MARQQLLALLRTTLLLLAGLAEELRELAVLRALHVLLVLLVRFRALQRVIDDADQVVRRVANTGLTRAVALHSGRMVPYRLVPEPCVPVKVPG